MCAKDMESLGNKHRSMNESLIRISVREVIKNQVRDENTNKIQQKVTNVIAYKYNQTKPQEGNKDINITIRNIVLNANEISSPNKKH